MKKSLLSVMVSLSMLASAFSMFTISANATHGEMCRIDSNEFASIADALESVTDSTTTTIQLYGPSCENVTIPSGKNIILDLNGQVIDASNTERVIEVNGTLEIVDSQPTAVHYYTVDSTGLWTLNDSNTTNAKDYDTLTEIPSSGNVIALKGGAITGGKLSDTNGGGIYVNGTVTLTAGNVVGNKAVDGAGISVNQSASQLNINGGKVVGNVATRNTLVVSAAGVLNSSGTTNITGGEIAFNTAPTMCGGFANYFGTTNFSGGSIKYNKGSWGGGCFVGSNTNATSVFNMSGTAEIVNNIATSNGAGIASNTYGSINLLGGTISGNVSKGNGFAPAGVNVSSTTNILTVGGNIKITGNLNKNSKESNVGLAAGNNKIVISSATPLASGAKIGVTSADAPTAALPEAITTNGAVTDMKYFSSDNSSYLIHYNTTGNNLELILGATVTEDTTVNGSISVGDNKNFTEGEEVTITVTPDTGYILGSLKATKTGDSATVVDITDNSFSMPAYDVTITATFVEKPEFETTFDSGYFSQEGGDNEGIIAFTSLFENLFTDYDGFDFSSADKFGMFIYQPLSAVEDQIDLPSVDFLKLAGAGKGYFYSFVTNIATTNFDKTVIAKPYAIINGQTVWGTEVTTSVNGSDKAKYLGDIENKPEDAKESK